MAKYIKNYGTLAEYNADGSRPSDGSVASVAGSAAIIDGVNVIKPSRDFLPGDANGDGDVDVLDLVRLRRHLAGEQVELSESCADLDGDGEVSILDLFRLRKLLVGAES